ncbi:MAG: undecaprenyl-phosphate galactose phosphotransferase WbaP [Candidatus Aminicenantes bacterium]|nr:undecaprenyl-phosphate galactose phosphotransferase WbaP [Candidatus Aminicenantes bacterium]
MSLWRKLACLGTLIVTDVLTLFLIFQAGFFFRDSVFSSLPIFRKPPVPLDVQLGSGFAAGAVILVLIFASLKLYSRRFSFWEETRLLVEGVTLAFLVIMTMIFLARSHTRFSRTVIVVGWVLSIVVFPLERLLIKKLLARSGLWRKNILILGTGQTAQKVAREIRRDKSLGLTIVGFLSERRNQVGRSLADGIPVVGVIGDLRRLITALDARDVVVSLSRGKQNRVLGIAKSCEHLVENIKIVPETGSDYTSGVRVEELRDIITLSLPRNLSKPWNKVIKNTFDLSLGFVFLLLASPFLVLIAAAVKIDSPGPAFFTQKRLGRRGKEFRMIKFRSMHRDAPQRLAAHFRNRPEARREWNKYQKLKGEDPRVTRVGRFLRSSSLDELPQILNVLFGDMSLVGPRPYLPREKSRLGPVREFIRRVRPGLTGLWQVRGRNRLSFRDRLALDEYYIRNWSLWLDIVILLQTVKVVIRREGAF